MLRHLAGKFNPVWWIGNQAIDRIKCWQNLSAVSVVDRDSGMFVIGLHRLFIRGSPTLEPPRCSLSETPQNFVTFAAPALLSCGFNQHFGERDPLILYVFPVQLALTESLPSFVWDQPRPWIGLHSGAPFLATCAQCHQFSCPTRPATESVRQGS